MNSEVVNPQTDRTALVAIAAVVGPDDAGIERAETLQALYGRSAWTTWQVAAGLKLPLA